MKLLLPAVVVRPEHGRVTIRGSAGTTVSGGVEVPPKLFAPVPGSKVGALVADLSSLNIAAADFGAIQAGNCIHGCTDMLSPVSFGGSRMVLARWPNINATDGHNLYTHASTPCGAGCVHVPVSNDTARISGWAAEQGGWIQYV